MAYLLVPGTQYCLSLQVQSKAISPSLTSLLNAAYLAPYLCRQAPSKLGLEQVWGIGWLTNELRQLSVGWGGSDPLLCNYMCLGEMSGPEDSRRLDGLTCCPGFVQYRDGYWSLPTKDSDLCWSHILLRYSSELNQRAPPPLLLHLAAICTGDKPRHAAGPPPPPLSVNSNSQGVGEAAAWTEKNKVTSALDRFSSAPQHLGGRLSKQRRRRKAGCETGRFLAWTGFLPKSPQQTVVGGGSRTGDRGLPMTDANPHY